jgi:glycosyltransferase involved in cell wall biosynthesis
MQPEFHLVVAGLKGFQSEALFRLRDSLGLSDAVKFTGWIPRKELYELFASATAFVYPSTFEGFGLPVLEALAAGLPTACSDIEPLSSIVGDAAVRFDPNDTKAICDAIIRITSDQHWQTCAARAGPQRAAAFSWTTTARATLEALRSVTTASSGQT